MSDVRARIKDMKPPEPVEVPLKNDKKAVIGEISLETLCWVEEKHGGWEEFTKKAFSEDGPENFVDITEFLFELVENKDEFNGDLKEFRKAVGVSSFNLLKDAMFAVMEGSMPEAQSEGGDPQGGDENPGE